MIRAHRFRIARLIAAVVCAGMLVGGCGFRGISDVPLPGGADLGPHPYTVRIEFTNVLDLAPQSLVKLNNVTVGRIDTIQLRGWHALVTCRLRGDVSLPDNATARIEQTTLLGEKFIQLAGPLNESARGKLGNGDLIPLRATGQSAEVEQVLSAISLLLNGGGIEQIATINQELNSALGGREDKIRQVLRDVDTFVGSLDKQKSQIVRAIRSVDKLAARLKKNRRTIDDTLRKVTPAIKVLNGQRRNLTKLLTSLNRLSGVSTNVIKRSKRDTLANLKRLQPILTSFAKAGDDLPRGLQMAATFPFPPSVDKGMKGDYLNLYGTVDLNIDDVLHNLLTGTALDGIVNRKKLNSKLNSLITPPATGPQQQPLGVRPNKSGTDPSSPLDLGDSPTPSASGTPDPSGSPSADGKSSGGSPSTNRYGGEDDSLTRLLLGGVS